MNLELRRPEPSGQGIETGSLDSSFPDAIDARGGASLTEPVAYVPQPLSASQDIRSRAWWRRKLRGSAIIVAAILLFSGIGWGVKSVLFRSKPDITITSGSTANNLSDVSNGDLQNPGTVTINRELVVTNSTTFEKDITVQGNSSVGGDLNVGGNGDVQGNLNVSGDGTFTGTVTAANFKGDGSQLTNIVATCNNCVHLQQASPSNTETGSVSISGVLDAGSLQGSGVGITSINASNITSGTVMDGRLSTNVALLNANNSFTGGSNSFMGNVGVGTVNPKARVHIAGSILVDGSVPVAGSDNAAGFVYGPPTNHYLVFGYIEPALTGNPSGYFKIAGPLNNSIQIGSPAGGFLALQSDANTGLGRQDRLLITASGNIGIGTSTPAAKLDVAGSILQNGNVVCDASNNCGYAGGGAAAFVQGGNSFGALAILGTNDNQALVVQTNGTEALRVDNTGRVGIGTSTPNALLQVVGPHISTVGVAQFKGSGAAGYISTDTTSAVLANSGLILKVAGVKTGEVSTDGSNVQLYNILYDPNNAVVTLNNSGSVGIGTTTPAPGIKLDVFGNAQVGAGAGGWQLGFNATAFALVKPLDIISGSNGVPMYVRSGSATSGNANAGDLILSGGVGSGTGSDGNILFTTNAYSALGNERMRITPAGNVGIGTTNPQSQLQVQPTSISYGAVTMTAVSGSSTFTTSSTVTLRAGDTIIPSTTPNQARSVATTATGTTFTARFAFTANVSAQTFTTEQPVANFTNASGSSLLYVEGNGGNAGAVAIGSSKPTDKLSVVGTNGFANNIGINRYGVNSGSALIFRAANGTEAAPTAVTINALLGEIDFRGAGTTAASLNDFNPAQIQSFSEQAFTDTSRGTRLTFSTTANNTTAPQERLRIDNAGNVGIGTLTPAAYLDVQGSNVSGIGVARFKGTDQYGYIAVDTSMSTGYAGYGLKINGVKKGELSFNTATNSVDLYNFDASGLPLLSVANTGKVGIGTTAPASTLDVYANTHAAVRVTGSGDGANFSSLNLSSDEATDKSWVIAHRQFAGETNKLITYYFNGATYNPTTTIDPSGNFGIGTTTPQDLLDVNGGIRVATLNTTAGSTAVCRNASNQLAVCSGSGSGPALTLQDAYNNSSSPATILTTSAKTLLLKAGAGFDSTSLFQVQNAAGMPVLTVDTADSLLSIRGINSNASLGSELISNSNFTTAGWISAGWTTTATTVTHTPGNTNAFSTNQVSVVAGKIYQVTFTVTGSPAAGETILPVIGGSTNGNLIRGNAASQVQLLYANTTGDLQFIPSSNWSGVISSVSVKLVTPSNAAINVLDDTGSIALEVRTPTQVFGGRSTFIGLDAGRSNTTGFYNTGVGNGALANNTTGGSNIALGGGALGYNTTGNSNTAIGIVALANNTSGEFNTALGMNSLASNTNGIYNTAAGAFALQSTTGDANTGFGLSTLYANTIGTGNVAVGFGAGAQSTTGNNNVSLGYNTGATTVAANANITGSNNTYVGYNAGPGTPTQLQNATAIGTNAVVSQSDSLVLGCVTGVNGCTNGTIVGIGTAVPQKSKLNVVDTQTATVGIVTNDDVNYIQRLTGTVTDGSASIINNQYRGLYIETKSTASNLLNALNGQNVSTFNNQSAGTITYQDGVNSDIRLDGTGNTLFGSSFNAFTQLNSSGSITNYNGLSVHTPTLTSTGTIGTIHAINIDPQKISGVGTAYGIYQAGANDLNYFAGNVGVGVAVPTNKLSVAGNANFTGHLAVGADALVDDCGNALFGGSLACSSVLNVAERVTYAAGANYTSGISSQLLLDASGPVSATGGVSSFIQTAASNPANYGNIIGVDSWINHQGGGTTPYIGGVSTGSYKSAGAGDISNSTGLYAYADGGNLTAGLYGDAYKFTSNNPGVGSLYGGYLNANNTLGSSSGTDNTYGLYSTVSRTGATGGTLNTYGAFINIGSLDNAGAGTHNAYGLYLSDVSGADNNYALYSSGTANSYFAGSLGIGVAVPTNKLSVGGNTNITGHMAIGADSAVDAGALLGSGSTYNNILTLEETKTSLTANLTRGIVNYLLLDPSSPVTTNNITAIDNEVQTKAGNSQNFPTGLRGALNVVTHNGSGNVITISGAENDAYRSAGSGPAAFAFGSYNYAENGDTTIGVEADAYKYLSNTAVGSTIGLAADAVNTLASSSGTDTTYGIYSFVQRTGATGGTLNTYGAYIDMGPLDNAGTGTHNAYSLYLGSPTGADNNFALYSPGAANSYFGGKVGIGTASPGNLLSLGALTTVDASGQLAVSTGGVNNKGIIIQAVAGQNVDLLQAQDSAGAVLASIDKVGNLTVKNATINGTLTVNGHIITANASGTTTAAADANAGTSATCAVSGNDTGGQITLTTGTAVWAAATQCTVTFATSFGAAPHPVIVPANNTDTSAVKPYVDATTTTLTINFITADTAQKTYKFNYFNVQ